MRTHRERGEKGAYTYAMAPMVRNASRAEPDASEIGKFSALAPRWWDPSGPMAPLHAINAARVHYVRDRLCAHVGRPVEGRTPLRGLRILDISNPRCMKEVAHYLPDPQPGHKKIVSNDVYQDDRGLIYLIDRYRGMHIVERI